MNKVNKLNMPPIPRFRDLMNETKTKREDVAKALGISLVAVGQYYNGETLPSMENLVKIADFFDVSTDYLLGRTDIRTSDADIKQVCELTGLSEKVFYDLVFAKQRLISDPPRLTSYECFLELIEEGYFIRICIFLANCILKRKQCFSGIKNTRDIIKSRIQEQAALCKEYVFSHDEKFLEMMDMESNSKQNIKFYDWELMNDIQETLNEYIQSKEKGIIPIESTMNFDTFIKECVAHGKHNKEE